uniref:2-phosphoxylose phosphatase 1 n=1 Tax=Macrostomum lignano TaxID=282301 RepID=A0A1I8FEY1_9PLAT
VTLLYRHGERNPGAHVSFRSLQAAVFDRTAVSSFWKRASGQHFELGKYLRRRYSSLLPRRFNVTRMHVRSTDTDRTIMSAQANLAGLFPDQCSAAADGAPQLPACYPVPPTLGTGANSNCAPMVPYASAGRRFAWLAERARVGTGWRQGEPLGISELWKIADPIAVWRSLALKLPDWVDHDVIAGLEELPTFEICLEILGTELYGSRIGALICSILQVYSAHDSTVSAFFKRLWRLQQSPTSIGCLRYARAVQRWRSAAVLSECYYYY